MGNTNSQPITKQSFGSIYPQDGKVRPGYYLGGNKLMYKGKQIPIIENESDFQKLKYGYLKSNRRVFYNGEILLSANPSTFSVISRKTTNTLSKYPEKNKEFTKLNCVLGMDFIGNKKRIFLRNTIIHEEI